MGRLSIWPAIGRLELGPAIGLGRPMAEARLRRQRPRAGRTGRSDVFFLVGPRRADNISPPSFRSSVDRVETQNLRFYTDAGRTLSGFRVDRVRLIFSIYQ